MQAGEKISSASALRKAALHKSASGNNSSPMMRARGKSMPGTAGLSASQGGFEDDDDEEDMEAFEREWEQAKRDLGEEGSSGGGGGGQAFKRGVGVSRERCGPWGIGGRLCA